MLSIKRRVIAINFIYLKHNYNYMVCTIHEISTFLPIVFLGLGVIGGLVISKIKKKKIEQLEALK